MTGMTVLRKLALMLCVGLLPPQAQGEAPTMTVFEDFGQNAEDRWTFVKDGVMGGVSEGRAEIVDLGDTKGVRLTGQVSTDNNGGFIQVRHRFEGGLPTDAKGLRLSVKGNGETYHVFLRTEGLARVWYSYRHTFETGADWREVEMNFADFQPSHDGVPPGFVPAEVYSIGIVAYGRDFAADVTVRRIEVY